MISNFSCTNWLVVARTTDSLVSPNGVGNGIDDGLISYDRGPSLSFGNFCQKSRHIGLGDASDEFPFALFFSSKRKNYGQAVHFPFDKTSSRRSSWFMGLRKDNLG